MPPNVLLKTLNAILSHAHVKMDNENDIILASMYCPSDVKNCYRHVLLSTSSKKAYSMAKPILYSQIAPFKMADGNFNVYPIYLQTPLRIPESAKNNLQGAIRNHNINVEHVWPRSKFQRSTERDAHAHMMSDLHNLYPSKAHVNNYRGNYPFSENLPYSDSNKIDPGKLREINGKLMGNQMGQSIHPESDSRNIYFMPIPNSRGRVARAMFYFSVRYKAAINPITESFLRKWHNEYPVTKEEKIRNDRVYKAQKTRNPFVDFPRLVNQIKDF